ncbi:aspartyl/asparaginyl beta-hydroxylase isoform X2 [Gopherus flavomarginatus]|uniref:aspartyl/asparaginyl beta-hydroxylase isoform X2 n=1 Tax=Gopherus flavomarginatus TaxID=286002 RepID=UPI0021CBDE30|nr:aspartyl/asparaginyl beta-hydroxylase isoform X2 [Gopherus flavomarginatus]
MAPRRNTPKGAGSSPSQGARKETKHGGNKNGKKEGLSRSSFFTWFMVIALLGVWTSVAVVWFELVDYEEVLAKAKDFRYNLSEVLQGKLGIYDADGDGDFDVEDAKVLLGLKERSVPAQPTPAESEESIQPAEQSFVKSEHKNVEAELEEEIQAILHEALHSQAGERHEEGADEGLNDEHEEGADEGLNEHEEGEDEGSNERQEKDEVYEEAFEIPTTDDLYEALEDKIPEVPEMPKPVQEETDSHDQVEEHGVGEPAAVEIPDPYDYYMDLEEPAYESEVPGNTELAQDDALEHHGEPNYEEGTETQDTVYAELETEKTEETAGKQPVNEHYYEESIQEPADDAEKEDERALPEPVNEDTEPDEIPEDVEINKKQSEEKEHTEDTVAAGPQETEVPVEAENYSNDDLVGKSKETEQEQKEKAKKKPKLLNKFDKTIKAELNAAEKLRKKGKVEEAVKAFEVLVSKYPQSPRARYGKAQCEDDLAEKMRSNEILQKAINTFQEVASLPDVPADLVKLSLKRQADRQQFLGHMRSSLVTLQKLVHLFPNDISLKNDLGVGYLLIGDNSNAKKVYEEVLSQAPNDGFAKVHYGFILKAENKIAESIPYLKEGLESGDPGTDDGRFYFHLGDALQRVGNKEAYKWYELGHQRGHFASVWQRSLYNVNGLKAQPWWTAKETGYTELVKSLEKNWKLIRDEGLAIMDKGKGLFLPEDENLREKGDWSQFTLWQQGRKNENTCKGVHKTCALLERFPEATGCRRGQIKYSIMHPGTHVWPHTGPTNCRLRMHLGLVIPKEGCRIRCAEENRTWEEGKVLIFDDSFEHEVWQDADSYRLIFIVDVWHPELTPQQRRTLPAI